MRQATDRNRQDRRGGESGVALVEFAIILPLLAILLVGVADIGALLRDYQILQNAAREGARFASLPYNRTAMDAGAQARIEARVIEYLTLEGITVGAADIAIDQNFPIPFSDGVTVLRGSHVRVEFRKPLLFPGFNLLGASPVLLEGNAVFRNLF